MITPEMEFIAIRESGGAVAAVYDRRIGEGRRSQSAATEESLRAFFERGGFAPQVGQNFTGEMQ